MKIRRMIRTGWILITAIICLLMIACSSDDYSEGGLRYHLWFSSSYNEDNQHYTVSVPWDAKSDIRYNAWLWMEFKDDQDSNDYLENYNRGKDWYLECDASWIMLEHKSGKVTSQYNRVDLIIQDNESDTDREAIIYMTVPEAVSGEQSLVIRQYGRNNQAKTGERFCIHHHVSKP